VSPFQIKKNISFYSILSISVLLGFQSCNQTPQKGDKPQAPVKSSMPLEEVTENNAAFSNYSIPPEFSDWPKYHNLYIYIKNLENNAFSLLNKQIEDLNQLFLEIKKTIPNLLNETSILSRLKVIETLTYKLKESYSLGLMNSKEFTLTKVELLQAQKNLIFQINKTFEKKKQLITKPN
jgi:hypothetical protein